MKQFYADLHIHSRYSIATSKQLVPEYLDFWARVKGISLVATGDAVHPVWLDVLRESLQEAEEGLYRLKQEHVLPDTARPFPVPDGDAPRFIITTEISTIFKRDGRVRKNHSLILLPSLEAAAGLQARLAKTGNIASDGRPILGLDVRDLLETVLENDPQSILIPAHIWTPWFSTLGSKSGFDSIEECFTDLSPHITAVETGLSSDPAMNRICSILDRYHLVSNSDAHSPEKLGRNATIMECPMGYPGVRRALVGGEGLAGTVDLYPQEGKYHFDGHRKCGVAFSPLETLKHGGICPRCGKQLTKGVLYRVAELADRGDPAEAPVQKISRPIIPLPELLSELSGKGDKSKTVRQDYGALIGRLGPELPLLLDRPEEEIASAGEEALASMIGRVRRRRVTITPGYDGEFGIIRTRGEGALPGSGPSLFVAEPASEPPVLPLISFPVEEFQQLQKELPDTPSDKPALPNQKKTSSAPASDNPAQAEAIAHVSGPCRITAGPGSGKTRVLTGIIRARVAAGTLPGKILALTFSNRAAGELRERLSDVPGVQASTLHRLGLSLLEKNPERFGRTEDFLLLEETEETTLLRTELSGEEIRTLRQTALTNAVPPELAEKADTVLREHNAFSLTDLIRLPLVLLENGDGPEPPGWLLVDEFQDINPLQYNFIKALAGPGSPNLVIVGDPDQAIYGFRGSDATLMDRFLEDFPDAADIRLEKSYRCPDPLLQAAHQLLRREGISGETETAFTLQECATPASEAEWIARTIETMLGGTRSFSRNSGISDGEVEEGTGGLGDFVVLCRTRAQFPPLLEAFANHGISCMHAGREMEKETARLRTLLYHLADARFPLPEGTDVKTVVQLRGNRPVALVTMIPELFPDLAGALSPHADRLGQAADLTAFLRTGALEREEDRLDPRAEAVSLITMHAAKGLEFNTVFIPGCAEGLVPFTLYDKDEAALLEEARLFYVALTRTKGRLFASYAKQQTVSGRKLPGAPSPFLKRVRENLIELQYERKRALPKEDRQQDFGF